MKEFLWYQMLYVAAKESYLDINKVVESPALEFLTFMNFYTRKTKLDNDRIKSNNGVFNKK
jgi:folate-binding Fe-S cluster repair protein YgfZ